MTDINKVPTDAEVRHPRGAVKINDELITGWTSLEVESNAYRSADTFRVTFVMSLLPADRDKKWFSQQKSAYIEVLAGFPKDPEKYRESDLDSMIYGKVDDITLNLPAGIIEVSGRDLTSELIDTKTSEHFANQTASQIAETLAKRHNLTPVVTKTTRKAGDYYKDDFADTTQQQSEWDLLSYLANVEGYDLFVKGKSLYFNPRATESKDNYVLEWKEPDKNQLFPVANLVDFQLSRNLTISPGIVVEVRSWNPKAKKAFSAFWPKHAKTTKPGQSTSQNQIYRYTVPGLTQDTAQQRAQSIYRTIVDHEMKLTAYMPADNLLQVGKTILVRGTGTDFDQVYYPESIVRTLSVDEGYRMDITAKNTSPDLEITS